MSESIESLTDKLNHKIMCGVPRCGALAEWRPVITIPAIEGIDKTPPEAELDFVLCQHHVENIDPKQYLGRPVREAIEMNLIKWCGRPAINPVDWSRAVVRFDRLLAIEVKEDR